MLGLRKLPQSLRNRRSVSSSHSSQISAEEPKTDTNMPSALNGNHTPTESIKQTITSSSEVDVSGSTTVRTTSHSESRSSNRIQVTRTIETTRRVRSRLVRELDDVDDAYLKQIDLQVYLGYIADERIIHMPKRGSQWDQVLKEAEFFGLQIDEFTTAVKDFITDSTTIRDTALASCYLLLQLGCEQAQALEPTFNTLYELGQLLANTLELRSLFVLSEGIAHALGEVINGLVSLLGDIAIFYHQRVSRLSKNTVIIDFDREFGRQLEDICSKREQLIYTIWAYKLGSSHGAGDVASLHRELGSTYTHVKSYIYGRTQEKKRRVEGTCEWLEDDLIEFLEKDESILAITGSAGCGKSMLASWVRDQLERPVGHLDQKHRTLSYTFTVEYPEHATSVALLRSLLSQLLEISIGDVRLFEQLSSVLAKFDGQHNAKEFASQLWTVLDAGLATVNSKGVNLTIIVDGLDEIAGGDSVALELYRRIHQSVKKLPKIRAVTFSRPLSHLGQPDCKHLVVTPEHVHDDIQLYLIDGLSKRSAYTSQAHAKQQELLSQLVSRARGSFLFAYLSLHLLDAGVDFDIFHKLIHTIKPDPSNNHDSLLKALLLKINLEDIHINRLLTFMVTAERPLQLGEVEDLLKVDLSKGTVSSSHINVRKVISATCGLLVLHKGSVRFKHSVVRNYIRGLCGSSLLSLKDAHKQLTMTLLLFSKQVLTQPCEPSFDSVNSTIIDQVYQSHPIVQYTVKYWIMHFQHSSLMSTKGDLTVSPDFKSILPESTFFVMMEWVSWQSQTTSQSIHRHELALRIRSACFGEKHHSVLQSLIILGILYRSQSELVKAAEFFYHASIIGQTILYKFSPLVVTCTSVFLACTEEITYTKRTTIVTYREEMMRFYIEVCQGQHGANSDQVIRLYESLVQLYRNIQEEHMVAVILKELHEIVVIRFGRGSDRERGLTKELAKMKVVLKKGDTKEDKDQYEDLLFEASEEMELTDELRLTIILRLAETYENQHQFLLAEKLYVALWSRICTACRQKTTAELQMAQLNIALKYVEFLRRHKRDSEACNIMVCVWAEYEHRSFESKEIVLQLKKLSVLFRSFGMLVVSVSILNRAWGWFKEHKMTETEEAAETTTIITEVVEEITETTTEVTTTTTETESITRDVYETTYTRAKSGKVDRHFFKASLALVSLHIKQEKWSEAEVILRQSLELVWKGVFSVDEKLTLEGSYISETVGTASRLALCYHKQRKFDKAEQIYVRVWKTCLTSLKAEDLLLTDITTKILLFYEEYRRYEKIVEIHTHLLQHYRKHLGVTHKLTINTLYHLASTYNLLGRKEAYDYYAEIVTAYTQNGIVHAEAFNAASIVLKHYREESRWTELQKLSATLWETITKHHHEHKASEEFIQLVYEQYRYVLEFHSKVEFSVLYKITVEYRETVKKVFGVSVAIFLTASIALAEVCEKSEEHQLESVTLYEEVITKTKTITTFTETKIRTLKKRLSTLYVTVITGGKKTETKTVERAITVCSETYEHFKIQYGWWHETTLLKLKELVLIYSKHSSEKSHSIMVSLLQESVIKILSTATVAIELYQAALTLSSIYKTVKLEREGHELLRQLRVLILFPGFDISEQKISIKLEMKVTKVSLIFLIALEEGLFHADGKPGHNHFSQIMADLLLETLLYEQYVQVTTHMTEKTSIEIVLEHTARLRSLWVARGRTSFVSVLDKKLFAVFIERYSKVLGTYANDRNASYDLFVALLTEIGDGSATERTTVDFAMATVKAINTIVQKYAVESKDLPRAHAVAKCGFQFASAQHFYHNRRRGVLGYKLAELLAGHGVPTWNTANAPLKESMLLTSRTVLQTVFAAFREANVDFVSLRFEDLSSLITLLGDQKNYGELENLLTALWRSREVQRSWSPAVVLHIGQLLIDAHVSASHIDSAIALADILYYNVRQSRGGLDAHALTYANKLSVLLTRAGRTRDAARVHAEVLRDLDESRSTMAHMDVGEKERLRSAADAHLEGLRRCGWGTRPEGARMAAGLYERLGRRYGGLSVQAVEKWGAVDAKKEREVMYSGPTVWSLVVQKEGVRGDLIVPAKERWGWFSRGKAVGLGEVSVA
ncbi:uncharacterized protein GGS22DRAFT_175508 [Annulohypoxylon maeteangense]|uniref:uncharacterized protein n=1 Tax=Annulohypoxylon maeteangense TaxID=1927788 RepID=UPI002008DDB0|nr:uncharacterized protein GGS22DRAFT_175508 [Annulohypoxylon maeteangense]KAI0880243.1 hypothetical protein GGS22DRAFT_175508 [Annulohypoxylon maeteangense]